MIQDPQNEQSLGVALEPGGNRLSRAEFQGLGDMPPELGWFANLDNPRTRPSLPPRRPGLHRVCRSSAWLIGAHVLRRFSPTHF
jgi:hypothetical protein